MVRSGDLKITQMDTPGPGVKIAVGDALIQSRAPGAERETYGFPLVTAQNYLGDGGDGIPGTGSSVPSGGRHDMVFLEILDPGLPKFYTPVEEWPVGQSVKLSVVQNVPAAARTIDDVPALVNVTGYALALITYPASTATVTNAMIRDLRKLQRAIETTEVRAYQATGVTTPELIESPTAETWPHFAETAGVLSVDIPDDARLVKVIMTVSGYKHVDGSPARGRFWFQLGANAHPDHQESQHTEWAADRPGPIRVAYTMPVPGSMRGTLQKFYPRARRDAGTAAQGPAADWATNVDFTATFVPDVS
ncbi:hypothetical protein D3228_06155 [Leucobacter luti]|nr:hypothetical protein [Leucobacter luti]